MEKAERFLSGMMDQNTSRGIAAVRRIKENQGLEGVYGTVGELFNVNDRFRTAVEVTAGNSLFHYVVDTDETATKVLAILNEQRAGRVTFMPLNRLSSKPANKPQANDAIDMMTKLQYDPKYEMAMQQVFGRSVICPNLQVAAQYARSHGVNAITPDGDRSDKKGALTGGYHDPRNSRLQGIQDLKKSRDEHDAHQARHKEIGREVEQVEQQVTKAMNELTKAEHQQTRSESSMGPLQQEFKSKNAELKSKQASLEQKRTQKANVEANLKELAEQQSAYEAERASEYKKALSAAEESQLDQLTTTIPNLRRAALSASETRSDLEGEKSTLEVELQENLQPRLDQLKAQEYEIGSSKSPSGNIKDLQRELTRLTKKLEQADAKLRETDEALEEANGKVLELQQNHGAQKGELEEVAKAIEKQQKRSEKGLAKRALLTEKATEVTKNIRDLGALPEDAFGSKFARIPSDKVSQVF